MKRGIKMNKVTQKIDKLRADRGWSMYKLSEESGVSHGTIRNWMSTNTYPLHPALESVCEAFGITVAEFFAEGNLVELTPDLMEHIEDLRCLSPADRASVKSITKSLKNKNN
jgi:transcriptional regulator with XRE-family HTH domain